MSGKNKVTNPIVNVTHSLMLWLMLWPTVYGSHLPAVCCTCGQNLTAGGHKTAVSEPQHPVSTAQPYSVFGEPRFIPVLYEVQQR